MWRYSGRRLVNKRMSKLRRYGFAVISCALALAAARSLDAPVSCFFVAVILSSLYGGRGPALLTSVLSTLAFDYFFLPPRFSLLVEASSYLRLSAFLAALVLIGWLIDLLSNSEKERRRLDDQYRLVSETAVDAIVSIDPRGQVTFANPATTQMFGRDLEEIVGHPVTTLIPEFAVHDCRGTREFIGLRSNGDRFPVEVSFGLNIAGNGGVFTGFLRDVTERIGSAEALKKSELYLAEAQKLSRTGSFGWSVPTGQLFWSEETYRILEWARDVQPTLELVFQKIHPEDRDRVREALDRAAREGEDLNLEHRLAMDGGVMKYVHVIARACKDPAGRLEYIGAVTDITEQRRAEEELRRTEAAAEERLRLIVDSTPVFLTSARLDGHVDYFNKPLLDYLGLPLEKVEGSGWVSWIHPEDVQGITDKWKTMLGSGEPGDEYEARVRRFDGVYRWFLHRAVQLRDHNGRPLKWYGSAIDIEDRKRAEEALRRSEAYLAESQRMTKSGSWAWNTRTGSLYWSQEIFRIYELDPATGPPTHSEMIAMIHPEDRPAIEERAKMEATNNDWHDSETDFRIVLRTQRIKHLHSIANPVMDKWGEVVEVVGTVTDVTERKDAEEALRRSEHHLAEAQKLTHTGSWIFDLPSGEALYLSDEWYRVFGFDLSKGIPSRKEREQRIHPQDRNLWLAALENAATNKSHYEVEFRIVLPDGTNKFLHSLANPLLNKHGEVVQLIGSTTDITEQKIAQDSLQKALEEIRELRDELYEENIALREEIDQTSMFEEIIGSSNALRRVLSDVARVAPTDSTVLITGETGTGKELIARAIHNRSSRAKGPFIRFNCSAIPQSLIASELFGHEKGAFTGATQRHIGRFELANRGTIFLDEIGELSPETQVTLLRVLQERELERIGGNQPIPVDVRVLTATNQDLHSLVHDGTFRQDLFYRLNVFPVRLPALRERIEDIPLLVEYLIERYAAKAGKKIKHISKRTLELFQSYDWPGNVRELQNVVERAVVLSNNETFTVDESWFRADEAHEPDDPANEQLGMLERRDTEKEKRIIEAALAETGGRIAGPRGAAAKLGVPRQTLDSKIRSLGINKYRFKPS